MKASIFHSQKSNAFPNLKTLIKQCIDDISKQSLCADTINRLLNSTETLDERQFAVTSIINMIDNFSNDSSVVFRCLKIIYVLINLSHEKYVPILRHFIPDIETILLLVFDKSKSKHLNEVHVLAKNIYMHLLQDDELLTPTILGLDCVVKNKVKPQKKEIEVSQNNDVQKKEEKPEIYNEIKNQDNDLLDIIDWGCTEDVEKQKSVDMLEMDESMFSSGLMYDLYYLSDTKNSTNQMNDNTVFPANEDLIQFSPLKETTDKENSIINSLPSAEFELISQNQDYTDDLLNFDLPKSQQIENPAFNTNYKTNNDFFLFNQDDKNENQENNSVDFKLMFKERGNSLSLLHENKQEFSLIDDDVLIMGNKHSSYLSNQFDAINSKFSPIDNNDILFLNEDIQKENLMDLTQNENKNGNFTESSKERENKFLINNNNNIPFNFEPMDPNDNMNFIDIVSSTPNNKVLFSPIDCEHCDTTTQDLFESIPSQSIEFESLSCSSQHDEPKTNSLFSIDNSTKPETDDMFEPLSLQTETFDYIDDDSVDELNLNITDYHLSPPNDFSIIPK